MNDTVLAIAILIAFVLGIVMGIAIGIVIQDIREQNKRKSGSEIWKGQSLSFLDEVAVIKDDKLIADSLCTHVLFRTATMLIEGNYDPKN